MDSQLADRHAEAIALFEQGERERALHLLQAAAREAIDAELVNDLAVVAMRCGEELQARELLRALTWIHPDDSAAAANLAALPTAPPPSADDERRARFLQVVAQARATHLADNIDYLFEPFGRELPDEAAIGERLVEQLAILDGAGTIWESFGDEQSRELFLRFLAYRALGPAHVRLQLEPHEYRRTVIGFSAQAMRRASVASSPGMPLEWQVHQYDLHPFGLPIEVIGSPLPLASTMAFSQYAYRDASVPARPRPGDVALDIGGCWGDTAVWLAHVVGDEGRVHTFEPTPGNRRLIAKNLELNPSLAGRVTVWPDALASSPGQMVWMPDVVAAGATMQLAREDGDGFATLELRTQSVDALVSSGRIPRVDFIKVDVEGADLGVLEGAAETIRTQRPRLALACYHKPDDLVAIPDLIASLGVSYTWYLQCSTMTDVDTVAFGVPADS
jgi:FkbM family methyltransferase